MGGRREHQRVTGWLGVIAVLGNLLASALCMVPAKTIGLVDDILGPLVLCTADGVHAAPGAVPQGGAGEDRQNSKSTHCTACTLLVGLAIVAALLYAAVAFPVRIFRPFASSARTLADHLSLGGIRSRAPPLPA